MTKAFLLLSALVACGGSSEPAPATTTTSSASSCTIAAGEDVCARADVPASDRAALEALSEYVATATRSATALHTMCTEALADLGAIAADPGEPCAALAAVIAKDGARVGVVVGEPSCAPAPPPSCAAPGASRRVCNARRITATLPEDASAREKAIAALIEMTYGPAADAKDRLEDLGALEGEVDRGLPTLSSTCAGSTVVMANTAADATRDLARMSAQMMGAIDRP